jgi:CBS domain-containing protein
MSEQANVAAPATAGDIMRSPLTTVEQNDHVAAAAYLMKHAGATAVTVLDPRTTQPVGIITEADVAHAVADGKDVNTTRIFELMTVRPTVINTTTSVRDAASSTLPTCASHCSKPRFPSRPPARSRQISPPRSAETGSLR